MARAAQKSKLEGLLVDNVKKEELDALAETERSNLGLTQQEVSASPTGKKRRKEGAEEAAAAAVAASPTF